MFIEMKFIAKKIAPNMAKIPDEIAPFKWTEDEWTSLEPKTRDTILWLVDQVQTSNVIHSVSTLQITPRPDITFMAVGMKYCSVPSHVFSDKDQISLEKEDDNSADSTAIKVVVDNKHVAYVGREYTRMIREIENFEAKTIQWMRNFPQSAKMKLVVDSH